MIAQDVQKVYPELISHAPDKELGEVLSFDYAHFTAVLLEGLKELKHGLEGASADLAKAQAHDQEQISVLQKQVEMLSAQVKKLESAAKH